MYGQVAKLTAADSVAGDEFGCSVAISGDAVAVRASGGGSMGAVYIFRATDGGASYEVAKLTADDGAEDGFGSAVAMDGVLVAAIQK